jgi:hypothetical protein
MPHRILQKRLQQQTGHHGIQRTRLELQLSLQAIAKTGAFDLQVPLDHTQFVAKGYQLGTFPQYIAQKIGQGQQHLQRRLSTRIPESTKFGHDVVQRVEQEVRVELLAEQIQARLRHFGSQPLGHFGLAAARFPTMNPIAIAVYRIAVGNRSDQSDMRSGRASSGSTSLTVAFNNAPCIRRNTEARMTWRTTTAARWRESFGRDRRTSRSMNGATMAQGYHCAAPKIATRVTGSGGNPRSVGPLAPSTISSTGTEAMRRVMAA